MSWERECFVNLIYNPNRLPVFLFRELILNHNLLRVLPFEIGKLFHLHTLGLHGNPLNKDVMSLYSESSGTLKLLSYMLDNLSGEWGMICLSAESSTSSLNENDWNWGDMSQTLSRGIF